MKIISKIITTILIILTNNVNSQLLTERTELKKNAYQLKYYQNNPGENLNELTINTKDKVAHFIRFESCKEDRTKLKGNVYGVIMIDGRLYNISIESANIFFMNENFFKEYKKLNKSEKLVLEETNIKLNLEYYEKIREDLRKIEEKKRLEEEKKRLEKERLEQIKAQELAKIKAQVLEQAKQKSQSDSITNQELNINVSNLIIYLKKYDELIDNKIKKGIVNGGILINEFSFSTSDYGIVSLSLSIINVGKKRIKYASFKIQPTNSVDDPVGQTKTFKGIGFIEPNDEGFWEFESAWFSDIIETLTLKDITLVYEDGSSKYISKIGEIRVDNNLVIDKDVIKNREKLEMYQFGSVALIDHKLGLISFWIYSVTEKDITKKMLLDAKIIKDELSKAIYNRKNNVIGKIGYFEVTEYSSLIYFFVEDGYSLLSLVDAENLLKKLNEIYPN
jgi:hypothetical protein